MSFIVIFADGCRTTRVSRRGRDVPSGREAHRGWLDPMVRGMTESAARNTRRSRAKARGSSEGREHPRSASRRVNRLPSVAGESRDKRSRPRTNTSARAQCRLHSEKRGRQSSNARLSHRGGASAPEPDATRGWLEPMVGPEISGSSGWCVVANPRHGGPRQVHGIRFRIGSAHSAWRLPLE